MSQQTLPNFKPGNMQAPADNNRSAVSWTPDFSNAATETRNFLNEQQGPVLPLCQSVYIDNMDNDDPCVLEFLTGTPTPFRISAPARTQGWYAVATPAEAAMVVKATCAIEANVVLTFTNFPMPYIVWPSANVGNVTANVAPTQVQLTNRGKVLSGGTEALMAANPARKFLFVQNKPGNANSMTLTFGGGSVIELAPGETFQMNGFAVSTEAIDVNGTTGDTINASEA